MHAWLHLLSPIHVNSIKTLLKLSTGKVKMLCTVQISSRLSVHVSTYHIFGIWKLKLEQLTISESKLLSVQ